MGSEQEFDEALVGSTGWVQQGAWDASSSQVSIGAGTPTSSSGQGPTTFTVSATGASAAVAQVQMLIDWSVDGANACYVMYQSGGLYLAADEGGWLGPSTPGSGANLSNSQCVVNVAATTVATVGNTVTINPAIAMFSSSFVGTMGVYGYASDTMGNTSGWLQLSTYTPFSASSQPPTGALTPNSGTGVSQVFTISATDVNGWKYAAYQQLQIGAGSASFANSCLVLANSDWGGMIFLMNDSYTGWMGPFYLNPTYQSAPATLSNSQCSVSSSSSSMTTSGNTVTFNLGVSFAPGFSGAQNMYLNVTDQTGQSTGWVQSGAWTASGPLSVTTLALPNGQINVGYSQALTAAGGTGIYSWSLAPGSGPLPAGLSLSTGGVLSGTPNTAASSSFTVLVTDSGSNTATAAFAVTILSPPDFTISAMPPSQTVTSGSSAVFTLTVNPINGFSGSVAFSAPGLNDGISFSPNPSFGQSVMTLAPLNAEGTYNITIYGQSGSTSRSATVQLSYSSLPTVEGVKLTV